MDIKGKDSLKGKKPKGRMSNYTFFVQMCREEHRKKHPNENVNFTEFSKKCAERWKVCILILIEKIFKTDIKTMKFTYLNSK